VFRIRREGKRFEKTDMAKKKRGGKKGGHRSLEGRRDKATLEVLKGR